MLSYRCPGARGARPWHAWPCRHVGLSTGSTSRPPQALNPGRRRAQRCLPRMSNSLVINSSPSEVRVALLENDVPCEVYIERQGDRGVVGNVYRGKVVRVLPGMQAAFVEIGLERTGFLYVN